MYLFRCGWHGHSSFYFSAFTHHGMNWFRRKEKQLFAWQKRKKLRNNFILKVLFYRLKTCDETFYLEIFWQYIDNTLCCVPELIKEHFYFGWLDSVNSCSVAPGHWWGVSECSWKVITLLLFLCHLQISSFSNLSLQWSFQNASRGLVMARHV